MGPHKQGEQALHVCCEELYTCGGDSLWLGGHVSKFGVPDTTLVCFFELVGEVFSQWEPFIVATLCVCLGKMGWWVGNMCGYICVCIYVCEYIRVNICV